MLASQGQPIRLTGMQAKSVLDDTVQTFVLVLSPGEEAFAAITDFANERNITAASVSAIGAFAEAKLGWFDIEAKAYRPISVHEQCEVLSLMGDVAQGDDGKASLHLHAVLGLSEGRVRGGHFVSGLVRPTLEITVRETVGYLRRKKRADLGLALISLEGADGATSGGRR